MHLGIMGTLDAVFKTAIGLFLIAPIRIPILAHANWRLVYDLNPGLVCTFSWTEVTHSSFWVKCFDIFRLLKEVEIAPLLTAQPYHVYTACCWSANEAKWDTYFSTWKKLPLIKQNTFHRNIYLHVYVWILSWREKTKCSFLIIAFCLCTKQTKKATMWQFRDTDTDYELPWHAIRGLLNKHCVTFEKNIHKDIHAAKK